MQGQGKINVRLQQSNCIPNHNNNLMGLGTIEINLLSFIIKCVIHYLIIRVMNHYLSISVIPKLLSKDQITVESSQSSIHLQHNLILSCIKKRCIYIIIIIIIIICMARISKRTRFYLPNVLKSGVKLRL